MNHKEIVAYITKTFPINAWWCQMVAVGYEKHKGLRLENERTDGFQISASKTIAKSVSQIFPLFHQPAKRKKWLNYPVTLKSAIENKKIRMIWEDNQSTVEITFAPRGEEKCTVIIQQSKLKNKTTADKMKKFWKEKLEEISE